MKEDPPGRSRTQVGTIRDVRIPRSLPAEAGGDEGRRSTDPLAGLGEVEQVCFDRPFLQRAKSEGRNPVYYVLGQTAAGRYLFCVIIQFPNRKGYPVTARSMTNNEKHRYRQWKNR